MHSEALPPVLTEIAEVAGADAAWALARAKGGQTVFIPASVETDHWLCQLVGVEAGKKIAEHYRGGRSGCELTIPMARSYQSRRLLIEALSRGATANQAAASAGMHIRSAYRARARLKDTDQLDIFADDP